MTFVLFWSYCTPHLVYGYTCMINSYLSPPGAVRAPDRTVEVRAGAALLPGHGLQHAGSQQTGIRPKYTIFVH